MIQPQGPTPSPARSSRCHAAIPAALAALALLAACSSDEWAPPPSSVRDDARNLELVDRLLDKMEERDVYVLELEDGGGVRVHLDRRAGGLAAGPVIMAPGAMPGAAEPGAATTTGPSPRSTSPVTAEVVGPSDAKPDLFHPANQPDANGERPAQPAPVYGGRVIVHLSSMPKHINYMTENSAVTRRMLYETHEFLLDQDWEYHDLKPVLATGYQVEDVVVLTPGAEANYPDARPLRVRPLGFDETFEGHVLYGRVEKNAGGGVRVTPQTEGGSAMADAVDVADEHLLAIEGGCVMTFELREGVLWHPAEGSADGEAYSISGHTLDARDVYFSWACFQNPDVDCDQVRFQFEKVPDAEIIDDRTIRFFYQEQYFKSLSSVGTSLTILPTHIYDLSDPDNPWYDPEATRAAQGKHVNENPHNQRWVGLGPYRIVDFNQQYVEAERFEGYFEPENSGYVDTIRWRYIGDDNTSFQALLNGELDYFERVKSADYFGAATEKSEFTSKFYKGYKYLGSYGYTGWNSHRPYLADKEVRQALAHAFPFEEFLRTNYKNLARQTTGPFPYSSSAYDHSVKPYPYDLDRASQLLEEAGFFDSDANGIVDRDGEDLVIDFMMPSGNDASKNLGLTMQENFGKIGVGVEIVQYEWATFLERMRKRDFDGCNLAWVPPLESDPEQVWASKWGQPGVESSNNSGIREPELDALILKGQRTLDFEERQEVWKEIHRYLHDWQPYLFGYNVPQKFAMSKRLRGFETFAIDPGYSIRRWHFTSLDETGTRATRER